MKKDWRQYGEGGKNRWLNQTEKDSKEQNTKENIIYARISQLSSQQSLNLQINYIKSTNDKYENYKVVSDIGHNFHITKESKGLYHIIDLCIKKRIGEVVIAHKDRIGIVDFDLIKYFIESSGGSLTILNNIKFKIPDKELFMGLLTGTYEYLLNKPK